MDFLLLMVVPSRNRQSMNVAEGQEFLQDSNARRSVPVRYE